MIRKKLPSAIVFDARKSCATLRPVQLATMRLLEIAKRLRRRRFLVRAARLRQSETLSFASCCTPSHARAKRSGRQVLPRGRQKTPAKYLKNNEKSSPGFVLRVVQRIESLLASGYGIGVGEWG
jgi:hypothetical protein